jgi:LmbE family N-acetylglucosaminyl deacetylase
MKATATARTPVDRSERVFLDWLVHGTATEPRVVVVAAHPDDETIGAGGRLDRLRNARFVYLTDGSPRDPADAKRAGYDSRESYAAARHNELCAALKTAGADPLRIRSLNSIDQEACFNLLSLTSDIVELLRSSVADFILTHPYEGGHPDHDAAAFVVHAASRSLRRAGERVPVIIETTSYHGIDGNFESGVFLPATTAESAIAVLSERERDLKVRLFACYRTQTPVLEAFAIDIEQFRVAPQYDFTQPPHAGRVYYETRNWGVSGEQWRALARGALAELEAA